MNDMRIEWQKYIFLHWTAITYIKIENCVGVKYTVEISERKKSWKNTESSYLNENKKNIEVLIKLTICTEITFIRLLKTEEKVKVNKIYILTRRDNYKIK